MIYRRVILLCFSLFILPLHVFATTNNTQLNVWANEAIVATYTYSYRNFLEKQQEIAHYFTATGWIAYSKALNDSKLREAVQKNNYNVSAVATSPPVIKTVRENAWQAVMPLLVVYKNPQYEQKQTLEITIEFITAPPGQGVRGLAINSIQGKEIKPACQCPVENNN